MTSTDQLLAQADALRKRGAWYDAATLYERVLDAGDSQPAIVLNLALCYLALGQHQKVVQTTSTVKKSSPLYWRILIARVRALLALQEVENAIASLKEGIAHEPDNGELANELADIYMQRIGDARAARLCVQPFLNHPSFAETALQTWIVNSLYDRDIDTPELVAEIRRFAQMLSPKGRRKHVHFPRQTQPYQRRRVGLISPYFSVSPVYFLSYSVLKEVARHVDLVFFDRGSKKDWAYERFQGIAREWVDVDQSTPAKLSEALEAAHLDVLIDMAGWSDIDVLRALVDKPCDRLYKWVGGQSATTGLTVFDGFLSDAIQTPPNTQRYYTEPLINLPSGYVAYQPPDYLPAPQPARPEILILGVVGNPLKVSSGFLKVLGSTLRQLASQFTVPIALQFIDSRYANTLVQARITEGLRAPLENCPNIAVLFTAPTSHQDFLGHLARLSAVIDTIPYSAGLTALEAMALGVPILGMPGDLCSERHAASHQYFSASAQKTLGELTPETLQHLHAQAGRPRQSYLNGSPRLKPRAVAQDLLKVLFQ